GATLFVAVLRLHDAGSNALEKSHTVRHIEAEVRQVVSEAVAVRPGIGDYTTSEDALVLELPPNEENGNARYAVFQRLADEEGFVLRRLAFEQTPRELKLTYMKTCRAKFKILELIHWGVEAWPRAVGLRFALRADENPQSPAHEYSIMAALGGIGGAP
ncbi:MAG: hypothetical protein U9Q79_05220, partial [Candidatus Hydrogenedentes bacterium]|nr:hypothetical protein [Candidatus Hydrogenedentota bacterium]